MKHLGGGLVPEWNELLNSSEGEGEENAANDKPTEPLAKGGRRVPSKNCDFCNFCDFSNNCKKLEKSQFFAKITKFKC